MVILRPNTSLANIVQNLMTGMQAFFFFGSESLFLRFFHFYTWVKFAFHASICRLFSDFSRALFFFTGTFSVFFSATFFSGALFEPTPHRCFIPVLKKMTQLGFFERGPGGGAYLLPTQTQQSCSTFFSYSQS